MRQSGGRGQYGHVWLKLEPNEQGKGYEFVNGIVGGTVPREYIPAVDKGIKEAVETGVIAGYPVVDVKVTLFDGSYHDVDSNEMAFKIAGSHGLQGRLPHGQARAARADHEGRGRDAGGLFGRRDRRPEPPPRPDHRHGRRRSRARSSRADVPLSEMFGYATTVRSMSQGRATFTMEFSKYVEVPSQIADSIIKN